MNAVQLIDSILSEAKEVTRYNDKLDGVRQRTEMAIRKLFGNDSHYIANLKKIRFEPQVFTSSHGVSYFERVFMEGVEQLKTLLNTMKEDIQMDILFPKGKKTNQINSNRIFIVHGHNNEMKETVARAVQNLDFEAVILHEMPNQGRTVIEKFTDHSEEVQYAIVLLSADDFAYPKGADMQQGKLRPRQNVVFELGYFIAKLGRNRVFPLYETMDNFEIHSDFAGVVLVPFDSRGAWKMDLGKELEALGVAVNWSRLMK